MSSMKKALGMARHMWMHDTPHLEGRTGAGCPHKTLQLQETQAGKELPAHLDITHGVTAVHLIKQLQHGSLNLPLST